MVKKYLNPILFVLLTAFWSGSFIGIKVVVTVFSPFFAAALRTLIALLVLRIFFCFWNKPLQQPVPYSLRWKIWLVGLFAQGFPFALLFWGERFIAPGLAGILNTTTSIWIFLFSLLLFQNARVQIGIKFIGLFLGMCGIVVIFQPSIGHMTLSFWGTLSIALMAVSYAIASVLYQYLFLDKLTVDFYVNLYHQQWASFIFLALLTLLIEPLPPLHLLMSPAIVGTVLYLGIFSTAIAWMIYYHLIHEWGAVRASTVSYVVPVITLVWDFLFFKNYPQHHEFIGVITILFGVVLLQCGKFLQGKK